MRDVKLKVKIKMKKLVFFGVVFFCSVQVITAQQKNENRIELLVKNSWIKNHAQLGTVEISFKIDSTYMVMGIPDETISGTYSLKGSALTFETETSCQMKGEYTIAIANGTLSFTKKVDTCDGRSMLVPGVWKKK
jgi:hypothetical protein